MLSLGLLKNAADDLGLDAEPEGAVLNVRLRFPVGLQVWLEGGEVRTTTRWGGRPASLYRVSILAPVLLVANYVWRHPPQKLDAAIVALAAGFLFLAVDHVVSEVTIIRTRQRLIAKAWDLDRRVIS